MVSNDEDGRIIFVYITSMDSMRKIQRAVNNVCRRKTHKIGTSSNAFSICNSYCLRTIWASITSLYSRVFRFESSLGALGLRTIFPFTKHFISPPPPNYKCKLIIYNSTSVSKLKLTLLYIRSINNNRSDAKLLAL